MKTHAETMVAAIEAALSNPDALGVTEVDVDGQKVKFDRRQLLAELEIWRGRTAKPRRPKLTRRVDLSGAF